MKEPLFHYEQVNGLYQKYVRNGEEQRLVKVEGRSGHDAWIPGTFDFTIYDFGE